MARVFTIEKSRKECKCGKCGNVIPVGSRYLYATPMHRAKMIRCTKCGLKPYETSGSEFIQTVGALQDNWREEYGCDESTVDSIIATLEELRDNAQDSLDNMPEQLQYAPSGEMLQERIDSLEDVISSLEDIDFESFKSDALDNMDTITVDKEAFKEYYGDDVDLEDYEDCDEDSIYVALNELPNNEDYDEVYDLPFLSEDDKSALDEALNDAFGEAVDEALGEICY